VYQNTLSCSPFTIATSSISSRPNLSSVTLLLNSSGVNWPLETLREDRRLEFETHPLCSEVMSLADELSCSCFFNSPLEGAPGKAGNGGLCVEGLGMGGADSGSVGGDDDCGEMGSI
jgi:hypothetical protein